MAKRNALTPKKRNDILKSGTFLIRRSTFLNSGLSPGEYQRVKTAVGGLRALIDEKSKAYETAFIKYLATESAIEEKLLENPSLYKTPIVRNGKKATLGYHPEIWETWE